MNSKSILLIGNGGSLSGSGLGKRIDEFDEVIRINEGKTKGWETDAGNKFTIWSTFNPEKKFTKYVNGYKSRGYSDDEIRQLLINVREVWYVAPRLELLHGWNYQLYNLNNLIKRHESRNMLREISKIIREPTTGFILIYLLSKMYDKFYIAGFDFFGHSGIKPIYEHYFTSTPMDIVETRDGAIRDFDDEWEYTKKLIDNGNIVNLSINSVIEKSNYIAEEPISKTCNHCRKPSDYYWWEHGICHYCERGLQ